MRRVVTANEDPLPRNKTEVIHVNGSTNEDSFAADHTDADVCRDELEPDRFHHLGSFGRLVYKRIERGDMRSVGNSVQNVDTVIRPIGETGSLDDMSDHETGAGCNGIVVRRSSSSNVRLDSLLTHFCEEELFQFGLHIVLRQILVVTAVGIEVRGGTFLPLTRGAERPTGRLGIFRPKVVERVRFAGLPVARVRHDTERCFPDLVEANEVGVLLFGNHEISPLSLD